MVLNGTEALYDLTGALGAAIARLRAASNAWVSDAQGATQTMDGGIKPVWTGAHAVGPAYTARCYPGSIITVHKALLEAPPGSVIVADNGGDTSGALFGELMATEATARGLAGVVIDGAVRDVDGLDALRFAAFARSVTPRVGTNRRLGTTQVDVVCGGVVVHPGDIVVAGPDGVVLIPRARLAEVVDAVAAVEEKEAAIRERMGRGERLADILGMTALIYPNGLRA